MKTIHSSLSSTSRPGWQLLGEAELSAISTSDTISAWLQELLIPLTLPADFTNQLLTSAQDATVRALHANTSTSIEHIHLSVFAPSENTVHGSTWGFFRIEKIDTSELNIDHPNHTVEFYLYLEGQ